MATKGTQGAAKREAPKAPVPLTISAAEVYVSSKEHVFVERRTDGSIADLTIPYPHAPDASKPFSKDVTLHYYKHANSDWVRALAPSPGKDSSTTFRFRFLEPIGKEVTVESVRVKFGARSEQKLSRGTDGAGEYWEFQQKNGDVGNGKVGIAIRLKFSFAVPSSSARTPSFHYKAVQLKYHPS